MRKVKPANGSRASNVDSCCCCCCGCCACQVTIVVAVAAAVGTLDDLTSFDCYACVIYTYKGDPQFDAALRCASLVSVQNPFSLLSLSPSLRLASKLFVH